MEDIESTLEEKINIEDLILPSDHSDQIIVACSSTMMKEEMGTDTCSLVAKSGIYSVTVCRIRIPFAFSPQPGRRYIRI